MPDNIFAPEAKGNPSYTKERKFLPRMVVVQPPSYLQNGMGFFNAVTLPPPFEATNHLWTFPVQKTSPLLVSEATLLERSFSRGETCGWNGGGTGILVQFPSPWLRDFGRAHKKYDTSVPFFHPHLQELKTQGELERPQVFFLELSSVPPFHRLPTNQTIPDSALDVFYSTVQYFG